MDKTITEEQLARMEIQSMAQNDLFSWDQIRRLLAEVRRQREEIERLEVQNEERRMIMDDMEEALAKRAGRRV